MIPSGIVRFPIHGKSTFQIDLAFDGVRGVRMNTPEEQDRVRASRFRGSLCRTGKSCNADVWWNTHITTGSADSIWRVGKEIKNALCCACSRRAVWIMIYGNGVVFGIRELPVGGMTFLLRVLVTLWVRGTWRSLS